MFWIVLDQRKEKQAAAAAANQLCNNMGPGLVMQPGPPQQGMGMPPGAQPGMPGQGQSLQDPINALQNLTKQGMNPQMAQGEWLDQTKDRSK